MGDSEFAEEVLLHEEKFTEDEFMMHYNYALKKVKGSSKGIRGLSTVLTKEFGYKYPTYTVTVNNLGLSKELLQADDIKDRNGYDGVLFIVVPPLD